MAKGGNFEREVAKLLSLWWTDGKREDVFYRSQASGGRFTSRRKTGKDTALQGGDITASDPIGEPLVKEWSIELKTGYGKKTDTGINRWDCLDFLDSRQKSPVLEKMWEQCSRDAELTNREPILIFRRNGRSPCIMLNCTYIMEKLNPHFGRLEEDCIGIYTKRFNCTIIPFQNFMEWIPNIRSALGGNKCSKPSVSETSKSTEKHVLHLTRV